VKHQKALPATVGEPGADKPTVVRPLRDIVLLKRIEQEEKSRGGIIIPDTAKTKACEGHVVAVGRGRHTSEGVLIPPAVKPGDRVLFMPHVGQDIDIDGVPHLLLIEDALHAWR
jgi:chaperonin GroES